MTQGTAGILRLVCTLLATLLVALPAAWATLALWYEAPGSQALRVATIGMWIAFTLVMLFALWQGRVALGLLVFAAGFCAVLFWWQRIQPTNDRLWADDVAQMTTGVVDGSHVTLHNVRNFEWRSNTDYTQRWETRVYDIDRLDSVDLILSYWNGPAIAHMLISFGFDDGQHVVFSVEIRRDKREAYSEIGGFFKQFELSIVAADERDVIGVRTNVRGEDDYLYRLRMPLSSMRSLFVSYVDQANSLAIKPRFYNTITVNCTMLVYHMMKRINGRLPFDYRVLLTGYLPNFVYDVGGLDQRFTLEELRSRGRITDRAIASGRGDAFSADIRRGIPVIDPAALPTGD
jgi:hypothetical protein